MKNLITLILTFIALNCAAQYITEANGRKGMKDADGNVLLPFEYDSILQFRQFDQGTEFYILRSGFKYGIYHKGSNRNTGCIYDRVYAEYNILYLRSKDKLGFVASDISGSWTIVEPRYNELFPIREYSFGGADPLRRILPEGNPLTVRMDSLWGIISYSNGHFLIPCKYRNEIITFEHPVLWFSLDNRREQQIVLNPETGAEFHSAIMCSETFSDDSSLLIITSQQQWNGDQDTLYSQIFNFATGERLWHHESTASFMNVYLFGNDIVAVSELYKDPKAKMKHELKLFTFYNVNSSAPLFTYEGNGEDEMRVTAHTDRLEVTFVDYWKEKVHYQKTIMR